MLGGTVIVAVDRSGAAALAAAGSARADPARVARLAREVLSRGAAAGLGSHGVFCCAVAVLVFLVGLLFVTLCCVLGLLLFLCALSSASAFHFGAFPSANAFIASAFLLFASTFSCVRFLEFVSHSFLIL